MDWLVFLRTRLYVVGAVHVLGDTALPATAYDVLEHMYVCCSTQLYASWKAKNMRAKSKNQKSTLKQIANEATKALVLVLNKKIIQTKIKNISKIILF